MHYSQKRRYYFFIAIAKFKTILSYYPRWRKLFPPLLILRSTFAQPSLMIAPHLRHTCATVAPHTLANFQSLPKLISCLAGASSPPQCLSFVTYSAVPARRLSFVTYSAVPARRLSFAQPSLNLRSRFDEKN